MSGPDLRHEAGIAIPFRQTDITLRNMDWLREAVAHYVAAPGNGAGNGKASARPHDHLQDRLAT